MKRYPFLLVVVWAGVIAAAPAWPACPTNFTCGFNFVQTHSFTAGPNDGEAAVGIGVLSFDASGKPTIDSLVMNDNGVLTQAASIAGTCTPTTGIGMLDFSASGGPVLDFLLTDGGNELRFITPGGGATSNNPALGVCTRATTLTSCPTTDFSCNLLAAGSSPTTGSPTPVAALGTIAYSSGGYSFSGTLNVNGTVLTNPGLSTMNCAVNHGIGTIDLSSVGGPKIDFVAAGSTGYRAITEPALSESFVAAGTCQP